MSTKKLISAALTAATILSMAGVSALPVASAQSTASLQAQIAALLAQIQQLQGQLNTGSNVSANFAHDLTVGSKGADVSALQQILISKGFLTAVASPTGFFGPATKAALAKWQASVGISPASGFFGPKTRAFLNSAVVGTNPGTNPGTTPGPVVAPASGLSVALSAQNPVAGALISSAGSAAARVPVLAVDYTAGNAGPVTVTELKFHKTGVISDSSISGAYLLQNGRVIAQYNSISGGVIDFSGLNWQIAAGQTQTLTLAIDPAAGLSAGNTVGFSLASASDITSWDANNTAIAEQGNFPINGNTFTVTSVSNPALATLTVASSSIGSSVTAGTQGNLVGAFNFTVSNSKVWLKGINFRVIGSANKSDLRNVKLVVNGVQAGTTLTSVDQSGNAFFDASANPGTLNTGTNNVQVFADVVGSPSYNFQFEILNSYDIFAVDSQYNVPITAQSNVGTQVTIQQGQITVTQDASTPTGNIAKGQSQITLAKFDFYAAGEAVKVKWLGVNLAFTNASGTIDQQFANLALTDDAGGQVGTTINTLSTSATCTNSAFSASTSTYVNCFGSSGSPINYIVPANTTRVLSLKADVQSTASFTTVTGGLTGNTSNLQGLTSGQTANSGTTTGSALTLSSSNLTVAANNALGAQNLSKNVTNQKIGSYSFTASSAEGVSVSNVSVQANGALFQNLKLMVGSSQFGTTQGTVSSGTIYSFSGSPFTVPAGTTINVDVYADVLSSASGSVSPATILTGLSASGQVSFTAISLASSVNGQNLTIAGQSSITVAADSSQAPIGQVVMGSTGNPLAIFRFTETSNVENVKVTDLNVIDTVSATSTVKAALSNLQLFSGTNPLGTAGPATASASGTAWIYNFHFGTPIIVPRASSISVTLKGDAASFASSGATDNTVHTFKVATTTDATNNTAALAVVALGQSSNASSSVTISSANGNAQTVLRSKLTFAATSLGATVSRGKISTDQLATLAFTANNAGALAVNTVTVTFSGTAPSSTTFLAGVKLLDENNNVLTVGATSSACTGANTCSVTWSLGATTAGQQVSAGTTRNFTLVVDSTKAQQVTGTNNVNLVATINATGDIAYTDGLDAAATTGLTLPTSVLTPISLNSVTYAAGT